MVKFTDLQLTLDHFKTSKTWDYGEYKLLNSDIVNYEAFKADGSIDLVVAQRILDSNINKALKVIKRDLDNKRILTIFKYSDLTNTRFIEALPLLIESQLSGMITDGNKEIKVASSFSGAGVDSNTDITGNLTSGDRLYSTTEDTWIEYQLDKYDVEFDEDTNTYSLIDNSNGTIKQIIAKLSDAQIKSIAVQVNKLNSGLKWLTDAYANITDFENNAPLYEMVKYNTNKDGSPNASEFVILIKDGSGNVNEIRTYEEIKVIFDELQKQVDINFNDITKNKEKIDALSGGVKLYHFGTKADADTAKATITFNDGDIAWIGTSGDWVGYHFIGGNWVANGTTSTHTATVDAYTKAESDAKFAGKVYDFTGSEILLSFNDSGGSRYQIIAKPASENAPAGAEIKLLIKSGATDPNQIPQDTDQITYGVDLLWINKATTDIMNWSEIKNNIALGKIMVITKLDTGNYQLVRWEEKAPSINDVIMDDATIIDLENIGITTR